MVRKRSKSFIGANFFLLLNGNQDEDYHGNREYVESQIKLMQESYPGFDQKKIILELLKIFDPALAWSKDNDGKTIRDYE